MSDLISRSELMQELYKFKLSDDCMKHEWAIQAADDIAKYTMEAIKKAQAVEAELVEHSEWTEEWQCKNCGTDAEFTEWTTEKRFFDANGNDVNVEYEVKRTYHLTKRCPNCGARMDAKGDGNAEGTERGG